MVAGRAAAATVRVVVERDREEYAGDPCRYRTVVVYRAGPRERNVVSVREAGRRLIIRDRAARVRAGARCEQLSRNAASCQVRTDTPDGQGEADWDAPGVSVNAGDLDDRVVAPQRRSAIGLQITASLGAGDDTASLGHADYVTGGPGDDRVQVRGRSTADVRGEDGDDVLVAGAGPNSLDGGAGNDVLEGGPGADTLLPGEGDDRARGGAGVDMLSYTDPRGVRVDLARNRASSAVGRVRLRSVEGAWAGTGNDVLIGDARANSFSSFGGRDVMRTGAGDDALEVPVAGSSCGPGVDTVIVPTVNDLAGRMREPAPARLRTRAVQPAREHRATHAGRARSCGAARP